MDIKWKLGTMLQRVDEIVLVSETTHWKLFEIYVIVPKKVDLSFPGIKLIF